MSKPVAGSSDDPDSCIPAPVKDFVFDLHDSARRSQNSSDQAPLYSGTFRELSSKYFPQSQWPSPEGIASECSNDPLFLAFYRELTHRHLHSVTRIQVIDRIDGWQVYRNLFDLLLAEAPGSEPSTNADSPGGLYILPSWAFDVLHEFVYQFQGFCQFRTQTVASVANKSGGGGNNNSGGGGGNSQKPNGHVMDALDALAKNRDAWAVETVLFYLHRLIDVGTPSTDTADAAVIIPPAYRHLALFASIALSRLECLLGDYRASLGALVVKSAADEATVREVFAARLSEAYHAGVSYLMLRRYKDATRVLGDICSDMQRGFKTGQLRKLPGSDQFPKLFDRMVALLAILTHVCPASAKRLDESLLRVVRDKHAAQLGTIEAGEEGYEELFVFSCPKFVSPAVPDYGQAADSGGSGISNSNAGQDAYRLQIKQFVLEMNQQKFLRKLRSYMKLYTSIGVNKLAGFNDTKEEEFLARLVCFKHKMRQLETTDNSEEELDSALDIHYYVVGDMVHVDEAEKQRRFENFFMKGIMTNAEIIKDVEKIETRV